MLMLCCSQLVRIHEEAAGIFHRSGDRRHHAGQGEPPSAPAPRRTPASLPAPSPHPPVFPCQFEGAAGAEFQDQVSQLCSQQSQALELIKNKQRKDPRFAHIVQVQLS